jgi:hypothetical protein
MRRLVAIGRLMKISEMFMGDARLKPSRYWRPPP